MNFLLQNSTVFLKVFNKYAINTPIRVAHFLGQLHEETGGFVRFHENLNYTPKGLMDTFGTNQISVEQANKYGRTAKQKANQEAIANIVYGGAWGKKNLGNINPGDGWKFRGRGLIQLTGRALYQQYKDFSGLDVIANPDLVGQFAIALDVAGWYWSKSKLNSLADGNNITSITKKINGGMTNFKERLKNVAYYRSFDVLGDLKKKVQKKLNNNNPFNYNKPRSSWFNWFGFGK
ncbi:MAG: hypothetical protein K2P85_01925 [Flavobacteriaceae bacterium]|nr:hypothetical protein [Flavobacteriaceae bacterium]